MPLNVLAIFLLKSIISTGKQNWQTKLAADPIRNVIETK